MDEYLDIIYNLIEFIIIAIIFLVIFAITLRIYINKPKKEKNQMKMFGIFLGMDNKSIISFSAITINYLFLVWCMVSFNGMNIYYIVFTLVLVLIGDIFIKNYPKGLINLGNVIINCSAIQLIYMLYDYIRNEYMSIPVLICLVLVMIFVFLYYTYCTFKNLNNVVTKNEFLEKKKFDL